MSLTAVVEARSNTSSALLTPRKKRRLISEPLTIVPSTAEIYKWVFSSNAIAPCFICDIRVMKRHKEKGEEFWWLKRLPCRTIKIIGLIVGIQQYEKRISYIVDDGTSVIECVHKCSAPPPSPAKAGKPKRSNYVNDPALPKPVAWIGHTVEIVGRIYEFEAKESTEEYSKRTREVRRQIQVQEIMNDKFRHWQTVLDLHKNNYSLPEPFTIPGPTPSQRSEISTPPTTTSIRTTTSSSSASTSASISSASSSPVKSEISYQSPRKLRHPSRLHTADLTGNTFRIYIKHYMDNPPTSEESDVESDFSDGDDASVSGPSTPTKRPLHRDQTPRCPRRPLHAADETPRPTRPLIYSISSSRKGFTLSYLRRVPELSELARRVVKAEAKRRDREVKKKAKDAATNQSRSQSHKAQISEATTSSTNSLGDSISSRMKRLWKWAIIQLIQEGSIILWDGPRFPPASRLFDYSMNNRIWKLCSSTGNTTVTNDVSVFSSSLGQEPEEDFDLSDPDPDEEAYVALTAELLAGEVQRVVQAWVMVRPFTESPKFTKNGILQRLRRDDRWRRVGEWHVEEAIELLVSKGSLFQISENVWGLPSRLLP
ncbi:uncharacterized protein C8R40DRAFT_718156 [Lentinula edodes]|uniref:uncharacterized protein n=1 Tax=Lentinula edodes TaxID=5353 RepID=UPI001E8E8444|nr:uncharacterized protein C8R40DRAFT_718156 [Lentinula edodes]KAH7869687.1 hypothetical protein C8R40DRAFT_718156 [Lentinula edodes]